MSSPGLPPVPGPSLSQQMQGHMKVIQATHSQTVAQYAKLQKADVTLKKVREQLAGLADQGDAVTQEDVVDAAGKLVAHGLGPMPMASLLADMSPDGQALQTWVQQHLVGLTQRESQLAAASAQVRHQLGQSAMHLLAAQHVGLERGVPMGPSANGPGLGASPMPAATPNALAPGAPNA